MRPDTQTLIPFLSLEASLASSQPNTNPNNPQTFFTTWPVPQLTPVQQITAPRCRFPIPRLFAQAVTTRPIVSLCGGGALAELAFLGFGGPRQFHHSPPRCEAVLSFI